MTGITITPAASVSIDLGVPRQFTATVTPSSATNQNVTWSSNATGVATVDAASGLVTGVSAGTATITATAADGGGATQTKSVTVTSSTADRVLINGVIWATCNADHNGTSATFASAPENTGKFYQWNRKTAWLATGNSLVSSPAGMIWDSSSPAGDSWATANDPCPTGWRLPTKEELATLFVAANVDNVWRARLGVNGRMFADKTSGNTIFFPAAGRSGDGTLNLVGDGGGYWSSTMASMADCAWGLGFYSGDASQTSFSRVFGFTVRCVLQ